MDAGNTPVFIAADKRAAVTHDAVSDGREVSLQEPAHAQKEYAPELGDPWNLSPHFLRDFMKLHKSYKPVPQLQLA